MSVVMITGCSTGIGLASAIYLAKEGHKVYATMRQPLKSELPERIYEQLLPIDILALDVNSDESVQKAVKQVLDQEGHIDVLVNNAGISAFGPVEESSFDDFKADMETNYFGTIRCIKAVLPGMRERKKGLIINISSVAGKVYSNFHGTYAPTKAAVEALSECLAQEVQPFGVRVAVVEPGVIDTPIFSKTYGVKKETRYPNLKRFQAFFAACVDNHTSPKAVAEVIGNIIAGKSNSFRNPAGPDAEALIGWRASQSDEDWLASTSIDDESWIKGMEEGMNLHVRQYMEDPSSVNFVRPAAAFI